MVETVFFIKYYSIGSNPILSAKLKNGKTMEKTMEILEPEKLENGEPFQVNLTDEEIDMLIILGLQFIIEESKLPVIAIKASKNIKHMDTYDLSKEELSELVSNGFNKMLRDFLNKE